MKTTWFELIENEMWQRGESFDNVEGIVPAMGKGYHLVFKRSFGGGGYVAFTIWTKKRIYFPATYDGLVWCASVSRNPDGVPTEPIGGG